MGLHFSLKLLQQISSLAPSLHTLVLQPCCSDFESTSSILGSDFLLVFGNIFRGEDIASDGPSGNGIPPSFISMLPQISCGETSIGLGPYFLVNSSRTFCTLEYVVSQMAPNVKNSNAFYAGTLK